MKLDKKSISYIATATVAVSLVVTGHIIWAVIVFILGYEYAQSED